MKIIALLLVMVLVELIPCSATQAAGEQTVVDPGGLSDTSGSGGSVNTTLVGEVPLIDTGVLLESGGFTVSGAQQVAVRFRLDFDSTLTSMGAHFRSSAQGGSVEVRIMADGGDTPAPVEGSWDSGELFKTTLTFDGGNPGWKMTENQGWNLPAGYYWLAFSVTASGLINPIYPPEVGKELVVASYVFSNGSWYPEGSSSAVAVRINGITDGLFIDGFE